MSVQCCVCVWRLAGRLWSNFVKSPGYLGSSPSHHWLTFFFFFFTWTLTQSQSVSEMSAGSVTSSNWPPKKNQLPSCCSDVETQNTTDCKWALKRHGRIHFQRTDASFRVWKSEEKTEERWQIDNEMAKSLILRIICFFFFAAWPRVGKPLIKG